MIEKKMGQVFFAGGAFLIFALKFKGTFTNLDDQTNYEMSS